jgi:hypothetical protein
MPTALCVCPSCQRHVRADEARCPFCESPLALTVAEPARLPRASRAVLLAAGAALALGGCDAPWISEAHADPMEEPVSMAPQYGAPPEWYEEHRRRTSQDAGAPVDASAPPGPVRPRPR